MHFRKMSFEFSRSGFPKYWHTASPSRSFLWNALSSAFPSGEAFFVESLRPFVKNLGDIDLKRKVEIFIKQESHHAAHHHAFNQALRLQGLDMQRCEQRNVDYLQYARRTYQPIEQLALTIAFEHFTASLAEHVLVAKDFYDDVDKSVAALWLWHAAEELEHMSVAFEVYVAAGGSYRTRVRMFFEAFYQLFSIAFRNQIELLRADGSLTARELGHCAKYLLGYGGLLRGVLGSIFVYLRRDFHPRQRDKSALTARWEERYREQSIVVSPEDSTRDCA